MYQKDIRFLSRFVVCLLLLLLLQGKYGAAFSNRQIISCRRNPLLSIIDISSQETCFLFEKPGQPNTILAASEQQLNENDSVFPHHLTHQYRCEITKEKLSPQTKKRSNKKDSDKQQTEIFRFSYDTNILELTGNEAAKTATTGILLVHPIGVGIGKWFYNRILESIYEQYHSHEEGFSNQNYVVVVPDLLGSGTACNPLLVDKSETDGGVKQLPLLTVHDWTSQLNQLMANLESDFPRIDHWCVVANGGCSPIALQIAATEPMRSSLFRQPVTNVILSSIPRLPFFLPGLINDGKDNETIRQARMQKVKKTYKRLCGILGRLFWWYALRRNGKFIQKFSEKNLVASPDNLGEDWTPNCVATARMYNGKSRYSTFSFLAGSLQAEGCRDSLEALKGSDVLVDIIQGRDKRRNRAKSWFWQKPKKNKETGETDRQQEQQRETLQDVLKRNGNRGNTLECGGRISLAYEDAPGYAQALTKQLSNQTRDNQNEHQIHGNQKP